MMDRSKLIQLVKIGQKNMIWDDDTYRAWLEKHTGKRSAKDCSDAELSLAGDLLRDMGALKRPCSEQQSIPGGSGPDRATQAQWRLALALSREVGMSGAPNDPALTTFCRRVAKVDNLRFLDKEGMRALICGLQAWKDGRKKRRGQSPTPAEQQNRENGP